MLATAARAMAGDEQGVQQAPVVVCLNPAGNSFIVLRGEATASRIFAAIGMKLQWQSDERYCTREKAAIVITFTEPTPDHDSEALAYASPYEGRHIVVYFKRLRETVSPGSVPALLAHVMAHEIAHILQGVAQHSPEGMMKRRWAKRDLVDMKWRPLPFSADDIVLIHRGLERRTALALAQSD
jgi:hypothetical protein